MNPEYDELLVLAETLGEVKSKTEKLEADFSTQARPLEAATNALSAALSGIKALQFHVLDNNLGALSARVEEMRKAVDEQVGVIALELKKADETNAAKAGQEAEALRSEIAALQAQLGTLGAQFSAQLERVEFSAKEEAKKLQLIPGPAGAAGASLNPRGTFVDGETYNRLDVVSWLGSSYIAAVDGVTEKPSKNSNQWQVLASRGSGGAGGVGDFGSLAGVAQINQGGTGQTTRAAGLNALLPSQTGNVQYMLLTDGAGNVSWGAQPVAGLPSQTGNSGELLTTDGVNASWSNAVTVSGSNATVTGTLSSGGNLSVTGTSAQVILGQASGSQLTYLIRPAQAGGAIQMVQDSATANRWLSLGISDNVGVYSELMRVAGATGNILIPGTVASTTTSSGALVVSGGVGVAGNINAGGYLRSINSSAANGSTFDAFRADIGADGTLGALNVQIGGLPSATAGSRYGYIYAGDAGATRKFYVGGVPSGGSQVLVPATDASTSTSSGALVVSGGVGVAGAIVAGGTITSTASTDSGLLQLNLVNSSTGTSASSLFRFNAGTRTASLQAYNDTHATLAGQLRVSTSNGDIVVIPSGVTATTFGSSTVTVNHSTASTSTSSGALVVSGGVGVAGAIYAGGNIVNTGVLSATSSATTLTNVLSNTLTAATNVLNLQLRRGDSANGFARLMLNTSTTTEWSFGTRAADTNLYIWDEVANAARLTVASSDGLATFGAAIRTSAPSGGTAANWKLGTVATVSPTSPNRTIEVDIGGTIYYIHAKTTNN